jgi:DNA-binding transcriptional LysR family regulator
VNGPRPDIGRQYYEQCLVILDDIGRAAGIADSIRGAPRGKLRIACPLNLAQAALAPVLNAFMLKFPDVEVVLQIGNSAAAVFDDGYDFALYMSRRNRRWTIGVRAPGVAATGAEAVLDVPLETGADPGGSHTHRLPVEPPANRASQPAGGHPECGDGALPQGRPAQQL